MDLLDLTVLHHRRLGFQQQQDPLILFWTLLKLPSYESA